MPNDNDSNSDSARAAAIEFSLKLQAVSPVTPASRRFNVTNAIIALNIVAFIAIGALGGGWLMPSDDGMLVYARYGASNATATTNGEWWRLVTSMFMHYGIVHIAVNMWALHQVGAFFERLQGRLVYALTYLAAGVAGGLASICWNADQPVWSAGASGAIFGIFGAVLGYMLRNRRTLPAVIHGPIIKSTLVFAVYNIGFGAVVPGIDLSAHIGGFVCGAVYGLLFAQSLDPDARARWKLPSLALACALLAVLVAAGIGVTPRYNYSAAEEMELDAVTRFYTEKSENLGNSSNADNANNVSNMNTATTASNVAETAPVYDAWLAALKRMRFDPALLTAKRQALMISMLQKYQQNWRGPRVTTAAEDIRIMNDIEQQLRELKPERLR